jgi:hypothetical protein
MDDSAFERQPAPQIQISVRLDFSSRIGRPRWLARLLLAIPERWLVRIVPIYDAVFLLGVAPILFGWLIVTRREPGFAFPAALAWIPFLFGFVALCAAQVARLAERLHVQQQLVETLEADLGNVISEVVALVLNKVHDGIIPADNDDDPENVHQIIARLMRLARELDRRLPETIHALEAKHIQADSLRDLQRHIQPLIKRNH